MASLQPTNAPSSNLAPQSQQVQGSSLQPLYTSRRMKMYALTESEAISISAINLGSTFFFGLMSFFLTACLSIYFNGIFYETLTAAGILAYYYAAPFLLLLAIVCGVAGRIAIAKRRELWNEIKTNSETIS